MFRSHPSFARRVDRWVDRWGRAFVMEVECRDGTRFLLGLDPNWHGAPTLAVADDGAEDVTGDRGWAEGLRAPDDLRDLVP
jgi:hypothetical protein